MAVDISLYVCVWQQCNYKQCDHIYFKKSPYVKHNHHIKYKIQKKIEKSHDDKKKKKLCKESYK